MKLGLIEKDSRLPDFGTVRARQRLNELRVMARYRRVHTLAMGDPWLWLEVVTDAAMAKRSLSSVVFDSARLDDPNYHAEYSLEFFTEGSPARELLQRDVIGQFWVLDLGEMVESLGTDWQMWPLRHSNSSMALMEPWLVGAYLGVTSVERDECKLKTIDAVEESASDRKRRANRDREAEKRRAAGATPHNLSKSATEPWAALGISRATYYRRLTGG